MVTPRNMPPAIQLTVIIYLNTVITVLMTDMSNDTRGQEGGHQALYSPLGGGVLLICAHGAEILPCWVLCIQVLRLLSFLPLKSDLNSKYHGNGRCFKECCHDNGISNFNTLIPYTLKYTHV